MQIRAKDPSDNSALVSMNSGRGPVFLFSVPDARKAKLLEKHGNRRL